MASIENQICETIEYLVDKAIAKAKYDKTIHCYVLSCINSDTGQYKVKYQDSIFIAYAKDSNTAYNKDEEVYVLIPQNDFSNPNKMILGSVTALGEGYALEKKNSNKYYDTSGNILDLLTDSSIIELCSYKTQSLYYKISSVSLFNINKELINIQKNDADGLKFSFNVLTTIPVEQQGYGSYGIEVVAQYEDGLKSYVFDNNAFNGNPYKFYEETNQSYVFLDENIEKLQSIESITFFCDSFMYQDSSKPNDIFISDVSIKFVKAISEDSLNGYYLDTSFQNSNTFSAKSNELIKNMTCKLYYQQQLVQDNIVYYLFKKDSFVKKDAPQDFCIYGGEGWRCLNLKANGSGWLPNRTGSFTLNKTDMINVCQIYKVVSVSIDNDGNYIITDSVFNIYNELASYQMEIQSVVENDVISLSCFNKTTTALPSGISYHWVIRNMYDEILLTESNSLIEFQADNSTFFVAQCSIRKNNQYYLYAEKKIINPKFINDDKDIVYDLIINNGQVVFKYNTEGISPCAQSQINPQSILPLSFELYRNGEQITIEQIMNSGGYIKWYMPSENTLIIPLQEYSILENNNYIFNASTLTYKIQEVYNYSCLNNNIYLEVCFDGAVSRAYTNFFISKEGDIGTNGTDYSLKVLPVKTESRKTNFCVSFSKEDPENNFVTNFGLSVTNNDGSWFKAVLYKDGADVSSDATFLWSIDNSTQSFFSITDITQRIPHFNFNKNNIANSSLTTPSNIIKVCAIHDGQTIYYGFAISTFRAETEENLYLFDIKEETGLQMVLYDSEGRFPKYNSASFDFNISINRQKIELGEFEVNWETSENLSFVEQEDGTISSNLVTINPKWTYDGLIKNNYISTIVKESSVTIGDLFIPVYMCLNRYGLQFINGWDGTSMSLGSNQEYLLIPQAGVGKKESDNSFTGVLMGEIQVGDDNSANKEQGLFGYSKGERTFSIDAETGNTRLGSVTGGYIDILPGSDSIIRSGNYSKTEGDASGSGMEINLSRGSIDTGSGKFSVTEDGYLYAEDADIHGDIRVGGKGQSGKFFILDKDDNEVVALKEDQLLINNGTIRFKSSETSLDRDSVIIQSGERPYGQFPDLGATNKLRICHYVAYEDDNGDLLWDYGQIQWE